MTDPTFAWAALIIATAADTVAIVAVFRSGATIEHKIQELREDASDALYHAMQGNHSHAHRILRKAGQP